MSNFTTCYWSVSDTTNTIIYLDKGQIVAEGSFSKLQAEAEEFTKAIEIMGLEVQVRR